MSFVSGIKNFGLRLKASAVNLYKAIPRDRKTLVALHKQKINVIKEAGVKHIFQEGFRTALNLLGAGKVSSPGETKSPPRWGIEDIYRSYPFFKYIPDTLAIEIAKYLPPNWLPITLLDQENGYTCHQLPISEANREKVENARRLVARSLSTYGYEGWSDEIDRQNDLHAFYFIVEDSKGEIVAASRIIHRCPDNTIPLEQGLKKDGSQYSLEGDKRNIIDVNSFYNKKGHTKALFVLFAALGRYAWLTGSQKAFCLLDENNKYITKLYQKAEFKFSKRFSQKIYYPTFGRRTTEGEFQPTFWTIMEMNQFGILIHSWKANKFKFV